MRQYTTDQLQAIIGDAQRDAARPQPVTLGTVGAQVAQSVLAGVGAALVVGAVLSPFAPFDGVLMQAAATTLVLVTGGALAMRAVPGDKLATVRRIQAVQRMVIDAEFRKREAYKAIEAMEAERADDVAQWRAALAELRTENKELRSQLALTRDAQRSANFVTRATTDPQTIKDASTMLEHWFAFGAWLSRPKAMQAGWTKTRHEDASTLLLDAGISGLNGKLPFVLEQYKDLAAALYRLNTFCNLAAQEPDTPRRAAQYEDD